MFSYNSAYLLGYQKNIWKIVTNLSLNYHFNRFICEGDESMVFLKESEFVNIYNKYAQDLFSISFGYTKNQMDSEDIVQQTFIRYLENYRFIKPNQEKYWLIRVCINLCKDYLKSFSWKKNVKNDAAIDNKSSTDSFEELKYLISKLPFKYRDIIVLFYFYHQSVFEISVILNISESAVKKRLERAREMLKKGID